MSIVFDSVEIRGFGSFAPDRTVKYPLRRSARRWIDHSVRSDRTLCDRLEAVGRIQFGFEAALAQAA